MGSKEKIFSLGSTPLKLRLVTHVVFNVILLHILQIGGCFDQDSASLINVPKTGCWVLAGFVTVLLRWLGVAEMETSQLLKVPPSLNLNICSNVGLLNSAVYTEFPDRLTEVRT